MRRTEESEIMLFIGTSLTNHLNMVKLEVVTRPAAMTIFTYKAALSVVSQPYPMLDRLRDCLAY